MFAMTLKKLLGRAVLALGLALGSNAAFADVILNVTINSASFGGTGWFDFQYSGGAGLPLSTATMSNLNGFDASKFTLDGDVAATANGFLFTNSGFSSASYEAVFDHAYSFTLTFAGDVAAGLISTFSVQAYNSDFTGAAGSLLDPSLLTLDWGLLPTGATGIGATTVGDSSVSAAPAAAAVPEPSSLLLAALGLGLVGFIRRQRA